MAGARRSSALPPNSMRTQASWIISPASRPIMCTPSTRSVFASARIFTKPSVVWLTLERPLAVNGNFPTVYAMTRLLQLLLDLADGRHFGRGIHDARDNVVVHVAGLACNDLRDGYAFVLGLVREHGARDDVADGIDALHAGGKMRSRSGRGPGCRARMPASFRPRPSV